MKYLIIFIISFAFVSTVYGLPSDIDTDRTHLSASYAKHKARLRANQDDDFGHSDFDLDRDGQGCDINIGNVLVDEFANDTPDEVVIIIEGDIIQANNCR